MEQQVSALEITFGSFHLEIQQSILVWLVLCVIFAVFFIWAGKKIDKADPSKASTGVVYVCEEILNLVLYVIKGNLREKTKRYLPFFGTLILMMLVSNLIGLVGLQNPTSNVSFNATLAVTIFFMIQINGIKRAGLKARIKSLSEPMAILLPMNIVGEIALPLSMTMRLFGNILGCLQLKMNEKILFPHAFSTRWKKDFLFMVWFVCDYLYSSQLLMAMSSMLIEQKALINALAKRAFVMRGMFKSIAARRIL